MFLHDSLKALKKHGKIIIAVPNLMHYSSRIQLIKGNFNYADSGIWDNTHFKWYTFRTAPELLKSIGFEVLSVIGDGSLPLTSILKYFLPLNFRNILSKLLVNISPGLFAHQIIVVAQKK